MSGQVVVFVCAGNTCRSPMAEKVFQHDVELRNPALSKKINVCSAGLYASSGVPAAEGARRAVRNVGLSLDAHRSRPFDDTLARADLILTMTEQQKDEIIRQYTDAEGRVYTLREYADQSPPKDILDPFGHDNRIYDQTLQDIRGAIESAVRRFEREQKELDA